MDASIIRTSHLTKSYGKARGIVDLDLAVRPGEVFGYLGPNGAGKTTTIRTLLDFIRPNAGSATVFGLDTHRASLAIRGRVGYLPGELSLYEGMTGREFLRYMANLRGGVAWSGVEELAERLAANLAQPIRILSHGNKQKLGLIQAFMHQPELLILDEPTQGLDPLVQHEFYRLIAEACARRAARSSSRRTSCPRWSARATAWASSARGCWLRWRTLPASRPRRCAGWKSGSPHRRPWRRSRACRACATCGSKTATSTARSRARWMR